MQQRIIVPYRRFGTSQETSVRMYHSTLRKIPEEGRFHLHRGGKPEITQALQTSYITWRHVMSASREEEPV